MIGGCLTSGRLLPNPRERGICHRENDMTFKTKITGAIAGLAALGAV